MGVSFKIINNCKVIQNNYNAYIDKLIYALREIDGEEDEYKCMNVHVVGCILKDS